MPLVIRDICSMVLPIYDQLLFISSLFVSNFLVQLLIDLFFVVSLFVAIVLFVYWGSCAWPILAANNLELTDEDIESMRWDKKLRAQLWHLFHASEPTPRLLAVHMVQVGDIASADSQKEC